MTPSARPLAYPLARPTASLRRRTGAVAFDPAPYALLDLWPAKNANVLIGAGTPAGAFDYVATLQNRSTLSGKASDATQGTSASQPLYLAHEPGANYLYLPGVSGNYASVPVAGVGSGDFCCQWDGVLLHSGSQEFLFDFSDGTDDKFYFRTFNGSLLFFSYSTGNAVSATYPIGSGDYGSLRILRSGSTVSILSNDGTGWTAIGSGSGISENILGSSLRMGVSRAGNFPLRGNLARARAWNTATPDSSAPVLDINFAAVPHRASSFVCATGQTVTINSTGNNPAFVVGDGGILTDGVDDFLSGTFASNINGAVAMLVADIYGASGNGRIFAITSGFDDVGPDSSPLLIIKQGTGLSTYYNGSWPSNSNSFPISCLQEGEVRGGIVRGRVNNGTDYSASQTTLLNSDRYTIAKSNGETVAMFLRRLILLPADASADIVAKTRAHLNTAHNLGLTLP